MVCYTCQHEVLPTIEAAFAANGYTVETPLSRHLNGVSLVVMTNGDGGVLLFHNRANDLAEIQIWGTVQSAASRLLEALPLPVEKRSSKRPV